MRYDGKEGTIIYEAFLQKIKPKSDQASQFNHQPIRNWTHKKHCGQKNMLKDTRKMQSKSKL